MLSPLRFRIGEFWRLHSRGVLYLKHMIIVSCQPLIADRVQATFMSCKHDNYFSTDTLFIAFIIARHCLICNSSISERTSIAVRMTNFATILNDLAASFEGRNEYISRLCSYPLLILDDFGMERGTEYGLEQVYSVIDSRYRSGKPLIATTNLTLEELQHPQDTPHARIYDRLTSMCAPVRFTGSNFRKETAQEKLERLKQLMKQRKESL